MPGQPTYNSQKRRRASQHLKTLTSNPKESNMSNIQFAEELSQEERIAKLRAELKKLGGSTTTLDSMPADMEEEFLRHVLEYENTEPISLLRLLENSGM